MFELSHSLILGTFFTEENGKFKVVSPPAGTLVGYIPDGYTEIDVGDDKVEYTFGGIRYRPFYLEGNLVYQVAGTA